MFEPRQPGWCRWAGRRGPGRRGLGRRVWPGAGQVRGLLSHQIPHLLHFSSKQQTTKNNNTGIRFIFLWETFEFGSHYKQILPRKIPLSLNQIQKYLHMCCAQYIYENKIPKTKRVLYLWRQPVCLTVITSAGEASLPSAKHNKHFRFYPSNRLGGFILSKSNPYQVPTTFKAM